MRTALVLAGHGSHLSPQTAALVWSHVDALRRLRVADEVQASFWKESPSFSRVLSTLTADDITVVPLFTAQGYFTRSVIPAEMQLDGAITHRAERTIRYARTLSEHPHLAQVVQERVTTALHTASVSRDQVAVAIIGHSTKRTPDSRQATEAQAELIRRTNLAAEVVALYLDDTPEIEQVYALTRAPVIIAVPFFLALGSHTTIDVPARLGLPPGMTHGRIHNREVLYTDPVGIDDALGQVIFDLAREAGAPLREPSISDNAWFGFPTAGHTDFLQCAVSSFANASEFHFGQLRLTPTDVRHSDDIASSNLQPITTPAHLRQRVREAPNFRPLSTSLDIPHGWRVPIHDLNTLPAVIETIYPALIAEWAAAQHDTLHVATLSGVTARQVGMFRQLTDLADRQKREVVNRVCGRCVLHPAWFDGAIGALPCAEPCNHWLSAALEALSVAEAAR